MFLKQEEEHQANIAKAFLKEHKAKCIGCGEVFNAGKDWKVRKYCSNPCYQKTQKGRVQTPEARRNIVRALRENTKKKTPESILRGVETRRKNGFPQYRPEVKAKISATLTGKYYGPRGKNHIWWRGGTISLRSAIYNSSEYKDWRKTILERDAYRCQECDDRNHAGRGKTLVLNVDHYPTPLFRFIDYIKRYNPNKSVPEQLQVAKNLPELWDTSNGRTLCRDCHRKTPTWGRAKQSEYGKDIILEGVTNES